MSGQYYSHLNPKCDSGEFAEKGGCGVFAREPIKKGELISLWGGRIVAESELNPKMQYFTQRILQIEEGLYLEAPLPLEPTDCFNHSCEPNVGFSGQIGLVAMRDIHAGEELNFDYAMCDGSSRGGRTNEFLRTSTESNNASEEWRVGRKMYWYPNETTPN